MTRPERESADDDAGERVVPAAPEPPVLAEQTTDDTDIGWGESWTDTGDERGRGRSDEEYLRDRPPHWE